MSDYNELLISKAGGDGDNNVDVSIKITAKYGPSIIDFTNVPMDRVHAAIALLNGDGEEAPPPGFTDAFMRRVLDAVPNAEKYRTKDFTMLELFPHQEGYKFSFVPQECCSECGAFVPYEESRVKHVTWHNKTLP